MSFYTTLCHTVINTKIKSLQLLHSQSWAVSSTQLLYLLYHDTDFRVNDFKLFWAAVPLNNTNTEPRDDSRSRVICYREICYYYETL